MRFILTLLVTLAVISAGAEKLRFDNYSVFRVTPTTEAHLQSLKALADQYDTYSFWSEAHTVGQTADVMVPPNKHTEFVNVMYEQGMQFETMMKNVQDDLDAEEAVNSERSARFGWTAYYKLEEIYKWLDDTAAAYPSIVSTIKGGVSYEGREIRGIKISYGSGNPGVFVEAGIHAREWISPATVTYIVNELLTSKDPAVRDIAEKFDWYVFPSTNPDGYVYTHTTNRMWRKTRRPYGVCYGADPNRNWNYKWMEGGSSNQPCSETYAGSSPFSEVETRTLSEYYTSIQSKISTYLAVHSYSQYLLVPYGHTTAHLDNYNDLMIIGRDAIASLARRYGTKYVTGNIAEVIYIASAGSVDWVKGVHKTPITFVYELRDTGRYGFLLPADQIIPTGEETLDSVVTILNKAKEMGYYQWN